MHISQHPAFTHLESCLEATNDPRGAHTMLRVDADDARLQLMHALTQHAYPTPPLFGATVSVKDLFDIAGQVTTAGSPSRNKCAPATQDAPALKRLKAAGAVTIGRTNMTEFAFSGIGINPHFGTPHNPADREVPRIPGGSSSGAAVSVGLGMADIGLGSDTGGSLRIPAALCGLVGFKSSQNAVPLAGAYPLASSLDTVGAITRDVNQAIAVHQVLSGQAVAHWAKPVSHLRLGIPSHVHLDDLDEGVGTAWENALRTLRQAGITLVEVATPALADVLACQSSAPLVAVEAYAFHRNNLKAPGVTFDPRVKTRIETAANVSAADYWDLLSARKRLAVQLAPALQGVDAMISPTVPMVAPALADLAPGAAHEEAYLRVNRLLLRNPSTVNFLDGCAITIPCQEPGQLPVGLMLWQLHGRDSAILGIAKQLNDQAQ